MDRVLLGLLIAASFGSGDYVGGRASERFAATAVLVVAQACSVVGAVALVLATEGDTIADDLALGALAGAVNVIGLALLYHGLARHAAAVVAPVAAVVGATVPVAWGFVAGERPSSVVVAGVLVAIVAGAVIALEPRRTPVDVTAGVASGALPAVAAGLALGSSLVLFSETTTASGQWPVLTARAAALATAMVAVSVTARPVALPTGTPRRLALLAGAFDVAATALLVVAVRRELLVVVAPIASLAPAFTVVLAWMVSRERLRTAQLAGLGLALVGLALIAGG